MPRVALRLPLIVVLTLAPGALSAQTGRCAAPRVPVAILRGGGAYTDAPRGPSARCLTRREFEGMRRARHTWSCTPARGARPATCTALGIPSAAPGR